MESWISPNFNERAQIAHISMIVLHYTGMATAEIALQRLCDPKSQVSAHYLIDQKGSVFSLVPEDKRAWHAGVSFWRGIHDVNSYSIGIELENPGHGPDYTDFPEPQIRALLNLMKGICHRWPIDPYNIVGHSDVAPMRKLDPGEKFPWHRLQEAGLIRHWPVLSVSDSHVVCVDAVNCLCRIGYDVGDNDPEQISACITAFQRRFMEGPEPSGRLCQTTMARLHAVAANVA